MRLWMDLSLRPEVGIGLHPATLCCWTVGSRFPLAKDITQAFRNDPVLVNPIPGILGRNGFNSCVHGERLRG